MSRILLCGAFGQDNPGDDALLDAFVGALDGHDVLVTAGAPIHTDQATAIPADAAGVARALRQVDAVVVGGGTIFKSLHPASGRHPLGLLLRTRALQAAARARGLPVALTGVGVGELSSRAAVRVARSIARRADLLVLRDEESAALLTEAGVPGPHRVGADPAWTLDLPSPLDPHHRDGVVVALSHLADRDQDHLAGQVAALVEPLVALGVPVRLQPWQGDAGADTELAHAVHRRLRDASGVEVVDRPRSLAHAVADLSGARAVVALRHHALVAASAAGCPTLAIAHEPKLAGLSRRLGQVSVPVHASPAVLGRAAAGLLDAVPPAPADVAREQRSAHRTMDLLRLVVTGGRQEPSGPDRLELTGGRPW